MKWIFGLMIAVIIFLTGFACSILLCFYDYHLIIVTISLILSIGALIWIASLFCNKITYNNDKEQKFVTRSNGSVGVALITAILTILIGITLYPNLKNIKLSGVNICGSCELKFFRNFQNENNGICKLCEVNFNPISNPNIFCIFPNEWTIINKYKEFQQTMNKNYSDNLLNLVCAKDCRSFLEKLNQIKKKKLANLKLSKLDQDIIAQILLLDQLSLSAACQTISGCSDCKERNIERKKDGCCQEN